jgi:hypothetical protein
MNEGRNHARPDQYYIFNNKMLYMGFNRRNDNHFLPSAPCSYVPFEKVRMY